ncbi:uncharacterized protein LOC117897606 isoform X4 [Drosophila subobscura]|uniref:uncharacterized protein LOC117897606 isoform X4 n=1 Tax=Drosophila subobscura TaxID=7241 RepID=UPI00155A6488|nr:uncharacterized protein LOC117897606 isoform X4 [Drosophila subobscura]
MRCVVPKCINATAAANKMHDMCFFKFPKNADLAKRWLSFCGNKDALKMKNACICINHFKEEDIVGAERFKLGLAKHISLGLNAVPCINLINDSLSTAFHKEPPKILNKQKLLDALLADVEEEMEETFDSPLPIEDFQEIQQEDCPEANVDESFEIEETPESLLQFNKCRTCYRDYEFDLNAEDPFDKANSVLLCRIEVICGIWLSNIEGGPRFMCPDCQLSLKNAIEFREMVISTEVMLTQGMPVCDKPDIEIELESTEADLRESLTEWTTDSVTTKIDAEVDEEVEDEEPHYEDIYEASTSPVCSLNSNKMDHVEIIVPSEDNFERANTRSVGRASNSLNELISEITGQDKVKPERLKTAIKAATPAKEQPNLKKMKIEEISQDNDEEDDYNSKFVAFSTFGKRNKFRVKKS